MRFCYIINAFLKNNQKPTGMKNYLTLLLFFLLIVSACKNKDTETMELFPSPDYPYTYKVLNQQEMAVKLQEFDAVNTFENLKLDEYGMLYGNIPVDLSAGIDSSTVKDNISFIINTYAPFLGITNGNSIHIGTDIMVHLEEGVTVSLSEHFQQKLEALPTFLLYQNQLKDMKMENARVAFYFSAEKNQLIISGRWYDKMFIPEMAIKNQDDALNIAVQYINKNHQEIGPLSLSTIKKEEFKKVIFPYQSNRGIEMRECWEVIFWSNYVKILIDTQTGEIIYYLKYGHMI